MKQNSQRCIWTGKKSEQLIAVKLQTLDRFSFPTVKTFHVSPQHEHKLRQFNQKLLTYGRPFLYMMIALTGLLIISVIAISPFPKYQFLMLPVAGTITASIGILIAILPFSTPETIKWLGLRRSIKITRMLGIFTIIMGITMIFLLY